MEQRAYSQTQYHIVKATSSPRQSTEIRKAGRSRYIWTRGILMFGMPLFIGWLIIRYYFFSEYNSYELLGELVVILPGVIAIGYRHGRKQWNANEAQSERSHVVHVSQDDPAAFPPPITTDDEIFYETVGLEMQNGSFQAGLWARAFAEADGDENRARAAYIRLRVSQLSNVEQNRRTERTNHEIMPLETQPTSTSRSNRNTTASIRRFSFSILACIAILLALILGISATALIVQSSATQAAPAVIVLTCLSIICGISAYQCIKSVRR